MEIEAIHKENQVVNQLFDLYEARQNEINKNKNSQ